MENKEFYKIELHRKDNKNFEFIGKLLSKGNKDNENKYNLYLSQTGNYIFYSINDYETQISNNLEDLFRISLRLYGLSDNLIKCFKQAGLRNDYII